MTTKYKLRRVSSNFSQSLKMEIEDSGLINVLKEIAEYNRTLGEDIRSKAIKDECLTHEEGDELNDYQASVFVADVIDSTAEALNKVDAEDAVFYLMQQMINKLKEMK